MVLVKTGYMTNARKKKKVTSVLEAWGASGAPLLPESLRLAWADERLPDWVVSETGLPEGSTMTALDSRVWLSAPESRGRRLCNLVDSRRCEIESQPVFVRPWPASLPDSAALERSHLELLGEIGIARGSPRLIQPHLGEPL
jgi:hypothetical protein